MEHHHQRRLFGWVQRQETWISGVRDWSLFHVESSALCYCFLIRVLEASTHMRISDCDTARIYAHNRGCSVWHGQKSMEASLRGNYLATWQTWHTISTKVFSMKQTSYKSPKTVKMESEEITCLLVHPHSHQFIVLCNFLLLIDPYLEFGACRNLADSCQ